MEIPHISKRGVSSQVVRFYMVSLTGFITPGGGGGNIFVVMDGIMRLFCVKKTERK